MSKILSARKLFKTYRLGAARIEVLKGVDLAVETGQFVAVVGASGSGKSTLLHLLGALDRPNSGQVFFEGQPVEGFGAGRLNRFRNRSVGFVFQFYHLLDELNVLENTLVPAMAAAGVVGWLRSRGAQTARARALLGRLGLGDRLRHKPYQLSGGERQRVAIARALINAPPLLLADEPTGNLDSETGRGILEALEALNRDGQTIVMVTHDERIAGRAHRVVRLVDGVIAAT
jgi:lipoprotein-releasing system ATP-binding protein